MQEVFDKIIEKLEKRKQLQKNMITYERKRGTITEEYQARKAVDVLNGVIEMVKQVATEYNNGWIPCSERLPNMKECQQNDCRFIVTDGNGRYQRHFDYKSKEFVEPMWHNTFNSCVDKMVIAWQLLPEPYQPKGE